MTTGHPRAEAAAPVASDIEVKTTICSFCAVGCAIKAEVQGGVWIGQEPAFDSPINVGGRVPSPACAPEGRKPPCF